MLKAMRTPGAATPVVLPESGHRGDIQGLRGVAVGLVVLSHMGVAQLEGGYVGVDVFFVLSGFLITGVLLKQGEAEGKVSLATFYGNRAKRILPAAAVVLVSTLIAGSMIFAYTRVDSLVKDVASSAAFVANWRFASAETDYFAQDAPASAVQHFWSLAVEEQFYLLWPVVIGIFFVGRRTRRLSRRRVNALRGAMIVICAASLTWAIYATSGSPLSAYFSTFTRGWELGVGALLALFAGQMLALPPAVKALLGWGGLAAVVAAAALYTEQTAFPGYAALLPVLGSAAIIVGGMDGPRLGAASVLKLPPLRFLGDISYSLYLWHWPFLILGGAYLGQEDSLQLDDAAILMAVAVAVSVACYYIVERPIHTHKGLKQEPRRALVLWALSIAVVFVPATFVQQDAWQAEAEGNAAASDAYNEAMVDAEPLGHGTSPLTPLEEAAAAVRLDAPVPPHRPGTLRITEDIGYLPANCLSKAGSASHEVCELGAADGGRTVVLFGDSTAAQWAPGLAAAARDAGWSFRPVLKYSCPAADVVQLENGAPFEECADWRDWAHAQIEAIQPDLVLTTALTNLELVEEGGDVLNEGAADTAWVEALRRTWARLPKTVPVAMFAMLPRPGTPPADCLAADDASMASCSFGPDALVERVGRLNERAAAGAGVAYVDPSEWMCLDSVCPPVIDGVVTAVDGYHISRTFSLELAPKLQRSVSALLPRSR